MDPSRHGLDQGCYSITALGTASVVLNICFAVIQSHDKNTVFVLISADAPISAHPGRF